MHDGTAHGVDHNPDPTALARDLQARHKGYWLIYFSAAQAMFVAMPTWPLPPGKPLGQTIIRQDATALLEAMYNQEQSAGVHRDRP